MRTSKSCIHVILLGICFVGMAACAVQTPIPVYVTPTPQTVPPATTVPTIEALPATTAVAPTLTETPTPGTVQPTVTFIGPVVGPEYTLPPTSTPHMTATPPPTSTLTPAPTATPPPTITPGGPTPTPLPGLNSDLMGVQVHPEVDQADWDNALFRVAQIKVSWIKVQVSWKVLQPNSREEFDTNAPEFQRLELYLQEADNRGFRILISVAKAPDWARSTQDEDGPPDDPAALAEFLTAFLGRNRLGDRIDALEVWNEPNLEREWRGRPMSGGEYMRYFVPAYNAIRGSFPNMMVITAGLAPTGDSDGSVDDRTYLQQMYNAGLGQYGPNDNVAIGIHPYSWGNPPDAHCCNEIDGRSWDDNPHFFFADNIEDYRQIMQNNGHADMKMWATEFGWPTWAGLPGDPPEPWMSYNTPQDQANYTLEAFQIAQSLDYMGPMILWNLNLAQVNPQLIEERDERVAYSLVLPEGNPQERPLYWMLYNSPRSNITPTPTPGGG